MLGGTACLYAFAAGGAFHGREIGGSPGSLPFLSLGKNYPLDTVLLLGACWGLLIGLVLVAVPSERAPAVPPASPAAGGAAARYASAAAPKRGVIARLMLLNGLLLISTLFLAYIGGKTGREEAAVGVFGLTAFAQMILGIVLIVLSLLERPKALMPLLLGIPIHLVGVAVGLLAFFVWGRGG